MGGPISYVITTGNSMEPRLHNGDLVLVKEAIAYEVGDPVAYRNSDLGGQVVLHRIIGIDGDRYVFKGDNNDFVDPYKPRASELIGKMWVEVGGAGRALEKVREPRTAALLTAGLGLMAIGGLGATKKRRGGKAAEEHVRSTPASLALATPTTATVAAGALVLFLLLGLLSFTRPAERSVPTAVTYEHQGEFTYSAATPKGAVYDRDIETGDPLFLRLVDEVDVSFTYGFFSEAAHEIAGNASLEATVAATNGWKRTIPLGDSTRFEGDSATVTGTLDLDGTRALIGRVERTTGVVSDSYQLHISPKIAIEGTVAGLPVTDSFAPALSLQLDDLQLQLPTTGTTEGAPAQDAFRPRASVDLAATRTEPNEVSIGPLDVPVTLARILSVLGIALALLAAWTYAAPLLRPGSDDDPVRIRARYGNLLVPMRSLESGPEVARAEVGDVEALVKIATRYDRPILHEQRNGSHRYLVEGDGLLYVYSSRGSEES